MLASILLHDVWAFVSECVRDVKVERPSINLRTHTNTQRHPVTKRAQRSRRRRCFASKECHLWGPYSFQRSCQRRDGKLYFNDQTSGGWQFFCRVVQGRYDERPSMLKKSIRVGTIDHQPASYWRVNKHASTNNTPPYKVLFVTERISTKSIVRCALEHNGYRSNNYYWTLYFEWSVENLFWIFEFVCFIHSKNSRSPIFVIIVLIHVSFSPIANRRMI